MKWLKHLFCKHCWRFLRNIYGDEINQRNGKRSEWHCVWCGAYEFRGELVDEATYEPA